VEYIRLIRVFTVSGHSLRLHQVLGSLGLLHCSYIRVIMIIRDILITRMIQVIRVIRIIRVIADN
jgi:hypothetical protein